MNNRKFGYLILILSIFFLQSCSSHSDTSASEDKITKLKKSNLPESMGFYYISDHELIEIKTHYGNDVDFRSALPVQNQKPEFVFYDDEITTESLRLYNHTGNIYPVEFFDLDNSSNSADAQMVQIKVSEPLPEGFYCFSDAYLVNPSYLKNSSSQNWCFRFGSNERLGLETTVGSVQLPPDQMGFFLLNHGQLEFIPPIELGAEIDPSGLPVTDQLYPTILFQSESINPDNVDIYWRRPIIGISYNIFGDTAEIIAVESGLGAELAGIQPGDVIVGINNTDVQGWEPKYVTRLLSANCVVGETIDIQILRGTQHFQASPLCSLNNGDRLDGLSYILNPDGYAIFNIEYPLNAKNVYCMYPNGSQEKFCFSIQ